MHRHSSQKFHDAMIEKRHATLDRMRHFHPITQEVQDIVWQKRFRPDEQRFVQRIPARQYSGNVQFVEKKARAIPLPKLRRIFVVKEHFAAPPTGFPDLKAPRDEPKRALDALE